MGPRNEETDSILGYKIAQCLITWIWKEMEDQISHIISTVFWFHRMSKFTSFWDANLCVCPLPGNEGWWSRWAPEWGGGFHLRCRGSPCSPGEPSAPSGTAEPCQRSPDSGSASDPWWVWAETKTNLCLFTTFKNQEPWTASCCHINMKKKKTAADTADQFQNRHFLFW